MIDLLVNKWMVNMRARVSMCDCVVCALRGYVCVASILVGVGWVRFGLGGVVFCVCTARNGKRFILKEDYDARSRPCVVFDDHNKRPINRGGGAQRENK